MEKLDDYSTYWNWLVNSINQSWKLVKPGDTFRNGKSKCDLWNSRGDFDTIGGLRELRAIQVVSHSVVDALAGSELTSS